MSTQSWFDDCPDRRNRPGLKWGKYSGKDIIPLWVADMDFRAPPAVIQAAREEADLATMDTPRHTRAWSILCSIIAKPCMTGRLTLIGWFGCPAWSVHSMFAVVCSRTEQSR